MPSILRSRRSNSAAELNFEIDLVALAEPDRLSLLDLLHDERGADARRARRCAGCRAATVRRLLRRGPTVDALRRRRVAGREPDAARPAGRHRPVDPAVRGAVGHFSTYSVVAVGLAGDYNHDGIVDAADYIVWRDTLGQSLVPTSRPTATTAARSTAATTPFGSRTLAPCRLELGPAVARREPRPPTPPFPNRQL